MQNIIQHLFYALVRLPQAVVVSGERMDTCEKQRNRLLSAGDRSQGHHQRGNSCWSHVDQARASQTPPLVLLPLPKNGPACVTHSRCWAEACARSLTADACSLKRVRRAGKQFLHTRSSVRRPAALVSGPYVPGRTCATQSPLGGGTSQSLGKLLTEEPAKEPADDVPALVTAGAHCSRAAPPAGAASSPAPLPAADWLVAAASALARLAASASALATSSVPLVSCQHSAKHLKKCGLLRCERSREKRLAQ